jgi:DNA-binding NtrC family response regulator
MSEHTTWPDALDALRARLASERVCALPTVEGTSPLLFARWLYRAWLEQSGGWGPFVSVASEHWRGDDAPPGWEAARGGVLFLERGAEPPPEALAHAVARGELRLWHLDPSRALTPPPGWALRAARMDDLHDVATDPALDPVRRSLLSHCRSASMLHLRGEHGVGKTQLAMWAHAMLDDRPLSHLTRDAGRHVPGQWLLFDELAELGEAHTGALLDAVRARELTLGRWHAPAGGARERPPRAELDALVGHSAPFVDVLWEVVALAPRDLPVLLTGEPGAGKEVLARALHGCSGRRGEFVAVDMGAIPEHLFESELFGHVKGAFTDARRDRPGALTRAQGGTLFLDEIGNLPPSMQVKLLRVLQERRVTPVGADRPVPVDCRVVAATNADLDSLATRGAFRFDLLSRLNAATLRVPPLRQRTQDIEPLARSIAARHRPEGAPWLTDDARAILLEHDWPGNVRELDNVIAYACAVTPDDAPISPGALGPLSPERRRDVPLITTHSSSGDAEPDLGLDPSVARALCATTLTVPSLRERGRQSLRHLITQRLHGRPVTPGALRMLEDYPWWGNLRELETNLAALARVEPGPLDIPRLRAHLPHLTGGPQAPLHVLLSPTLTPSGQVEGLSWEVDAGALLIGRTARFEHVRAAATRDARAQECLEVITRAAPAQVEPRCLELGFMRRLSRVHALLTHSPEGLAVRAMPGVRLEVHARAFGESERARALPDAPASLGVAGEICFVRPRSQEVYLQLFVFVGQSARARFARQAWMAHRALEQSATSTLADDTLHAEREASADEDTLHRWALAPHEVDALVDVCASFRGGMFKHHVAMRVDALRGDPELTHLVDFLERAPRTSQYITRLFTFEPNDPLRQALTDRLTGDPEADAWLELLPVGISRSLSS